MNKPLSKEQRDAIKVKPTEYEQFQSKFRELAEFTLEKPDENICLLEFKSDCGTACCIGGNAVELWPEEYKFQPDKYGGLLPESIQHPAFRGIDIIHTFYDYQKVHYVRKAQLTKLFFPNIIDGFLTDREEIERRLTMVNESTSFEELVFKINRRR